MGNEGSSLFGTGPQKVVSDTEQVPTGEMNQSKSTMPAAISVEEQEATSAEQQAEQARYSELFGGKPKPKPKASASVAGRGSVGSTGAASSKSKTASRHTKKKQRSGKASHDTKADATAAGLTATEDAGSSASSPEDGEGGGGDSAPTSPYRGKAAWMEGEPAAAVATKDKNENKKGCAPAMTEVERQKQLVAAVSAKIIDLEKSKRGGRANLAVQGLEDEETEAAVAGGASKTARNRAAVANALFAGAEPTASSTKALLVSFGGGGGLLDNIHGTREAGDAAAMSAKNMSPRPAPLRNYRVVN